MSKLATREDFKQLMGWSGDELDTLIDALLERASAVAERIAGHKLMREADVTEYPWDPVTHPRCVRLARFPIESVSSVKQLYDFGTDSDFDGQGALTENDDYVVDATTGKLCRIHGWWTAKRRHLQVIYTAGYYDPGGAAPTPDAIEPPKALQDGVLQHAIRMYQQRNTAGLANVNLGQGGSMSTPDVEPHPSLLDACTRLRMWEMG